MAKIRVTISDDHAILRTGLRAVISDKPDLVVVGEAQSAHETIGLVREHRPDVAIVVVSMRDASAISVLPALREASPSTRILMLTMHGDHPTVREALLAGAHGYLIKEAHHEEVVSAIRTLAQGRSFVSVPVEESGLSRVMQSERVAAPAGGLARPLSAREREVLALFANGRTHREIARLLGLRLKTVETYRSRLGDKLGARTKAELVSCAQALGLLVSDSPDSPDSDDSPAKTVAS